MEKAVFTPLQMVQTYLCAGNTLQLRLNRRGSVVKHVEACLSARKDRGDLSFQMWRSCETGANLFVCGKHPTTPFSPPRRCCEARAGLFKSQKRWRAQFSQLWKSCEAGANLFIYICGKHHTTPFSPPRWCRETRAGLFKCQKRWRKQFSPLW